MTMQNPRRVALFAAGALVAALTTVTSVPALADTLPGGGGDCSDVMHESVPAAGKIKFTWKMTCSRNWSKIEHGITVQRSGMQTVAVTRTCLSTSATLRTCSGSVTLNDPAGVQHWKTYDETARYAFAGSGAIRASYSAGAYH